MHARNIAIAEKFDLRPFSFRVSRLNDAKVEFIHKQTNHRFVCAHNTPLFWYCFYCSYFLCCLALLYSVVFCMIKVLCYLLSFHVCLQRFPVVYFVLCVLTLCPHTIKKCKQMLCVRTQRVKFITDI